jgi:hypothetical protein
MIKSIKKYLNIRKKNLYPISECLICYEDYALTNDNFIFFICAHKICIKCYVNMKRYNKEKNIIMRCPLCNTLIN